MKQLKLVMTFCAVLLTGILFMQSTTYAASCCVGIRGNVDGDVEELVDISDLVYLVDFMFTSGPAPVCSEEGNIDGDIGNLIDISDLVYLVDFMFTSGPAPLDCPASDEVVFVDEYGTGVTYLAFAGSKVDAVQIDSINSNWYAGTKGLDINIPGVDPWWSGGVFADTSDSYAGRDLTGFNALTFWAKASTSATLDVMGLGNDNSGNSLYTAEMAGIPLTTAWQKYVIPIPLAEKLTNEAGLFYFAEGEGIDYQIYIDEIIFENLGTITNPRPVLAPATVDVNLGETVSLANGTVTFNVDGTDVDVSAMPGYFTYASSDELVVSVGLDGVITAVGEGTATLTADLGTTAATGSITVNVTSAEVVPAGPAPTPTVPAIDVVSLYSDAYTSAIIDTWSAGWDNADVEDYMIGADSTKKYTNLVFAGVEFTSNTIDASTTSHFHMDLWTPDATAAPAVFKVKLVDFGADGAFGGGDDVEHEVTFDENTLSTEGWVGIDIPLATFTNLTTTGHLAQMIISGDLSTVYLDNIYFYDAGLPTEPTVAAPSPTVDEAFVVSLYSDAYSSATVDTWSAVWDAADVADFVVDSDNMKQYTSLSFAGIEFTSSPLDASSTDRFHMDVWTPSSTDAPALFKVKLVDFGADGMFGGGDDVEHEISFDENTMNTGSWVSIDIPMTDFTNLTTTGALAQMIISGDLSTVFIDNIYFYTVPPTEPQAPAPTPSHSAVDVISLYSDAYTDVTVDTWSAGWDMADYIDTVIAADNVKKYTNLSFAGIEFTSSVIDASTMTHFHIDLWTADPTSAPAVFKIKLVDFGADGVWSGGDDVEHEITFDEVTMNSSNWVSIDIPLTDFVNLTTTGSLAQMIISGDPNTVFVDNVYLHK